VREDLQVAEVVERPELGRHPGLHGRTELCGKIAS
jgi:hypothetical protein